MKLLILIAVVACTNGDKLDRTYLPPNHAQTSGGSGNFLQAPTHSFQRNGPGPSRGFQAGNDYAKAGNVNNYAQNGNGFAHSATGNDFPRGGNQYAQTGNDYTQGSGFQANLNNLEARPERAQAAFERNAAILRQDNQNDGETYSYSYETENGIIAEESGVATNGVEAQGGFSYTGDDGQVYSIRYTADQNGFIPQGEHLPTPPPIPEEILKALEKNARDEANGIYDDGTYNEAKYGAETADNGQNYNYDNGNNYNGGSNEPNNFNGANFNNVNNYNDNSDDEDTVITNSAQLRNAGTFSNQNHRGTTQAYLPPFEAQRSPGFSNQGLRNSAKYQADSTPPFIALERNQGTFRNQGPSNQRFASQVNNAYLPPNGQRAVQRNGNGRGPSFNSRSGYQY